MRTAAWFLTLFGISYLVPSYWLWKHHIHIRDTWPAAEAISDGSRILHARGKRGLVFQPQYDLHYRVSSRDYVTPLAERGWTSSRSRAEEVAARYAAGTRHTVWYDPANPHSIRRDVGSWTLFALPAAFTFVGALTLSIGAWLMRVPNKRVKRRKAAIAVPPEPSDRRAHVIAGCVFGGIGLALLVGAAAWAYRQFYVFATWPEVPATVLESKLDYRSVSSRGLSFSTQVRFDYQVEGVRHRSVAEPEQSSNYGWIRQRLDRYTPGSQHRVRYDPANPTRIRTHVEPDAALFLPVATLGAMGFLFAILGYAILTPALRRQQATDSGASAAP